MLRLNAAVLWGQEGMNVNPSWNDVGMSWVLALVVILALIA